MADPEYSLWVLYRKSAFWLMIMIIPIGIAVGTKSFYVMVGSLISVAWSVHKYKGYEREIESMLAERKARV